MHRHFVALHAQMQSFLHCLIVIVVSERLASHMIGVFPALLNPEKHTNPQFLVGSQIGAEQFLEAMLRYLPGETIGLFVPETSMSKAGYDVARLLRNEPHSGNSVSICGMSSLPQLLRSTPLLALHDASGLKRL